MSPLSYLTKSIREQETKTVVFVDSLAIPTSHNINCKYFCLLYYMLYTLLHTHTGGIIEGSLGIGDYTGDIRSFVEIGPGGPVEVIPRPWICDINGDGSSAQWQTPNGSIVPTVPPTLPAGFQLTGSELYTTLVVDIHGVYRLRLFRGPLYNSPDGEYCCVLTAVPNQRRCVTLSKYGSVEAFRVKLFPSLTSCSMFELEFI